MTATNQAQYVEEILQRVAGDLSMITDRDLVIESVEMEKRKERPAGEGKIHVSFRIAFEIDEQVHHGCLLIPLPHAIALAGGLMMMPTEAIEEVRHLDTVDATTREAMVELGTFICGAADAAFRVLGNEGFQVHFEGCQGVRADVRPALVYQEGLPLVVGRATVRMADFDAEQTLLILPEALLSA
ncbi:MAG: hypothetical protein GY711_19660 [bacterium]|nr:hypothetical protein [bacterium]